MSTRGEKARESGGEIVHTKTTRFGQPKISPRVCLYPLHSQHQALLSAQSRPRQLAAKSWLYKLPLDIFHAVHYNHSGMLYKLMEKRTQDATKFATNWTRSLRSAAGFNLRYLGLTVFRHVFCHQLLAVGNVHDITRQPSHD